jgi:hypothetical protein
MVELDARAAKTCWFALTAYQNKLKDDRETRYNGNVNYGQEDEEFLTEEIGNAEHALAQLQEHGVQY